MSFEKAKIYLEKRGLASHIIVPEEATATVEEAAKALGTEPGAIAKTLSFLVDEKPVLILVEGTAKIDNHKYKEFFHTKAKMIPREEVESLIGHAPGGVCPFGVNSGIKVYFDESLRKHGTIYPAAGDDHSGVRLTTAELESAVDSFEWIDVCKSLLTENALRENQNCRKCHPAFSTSTRNSS